MSTISIHSHLFSNPETRKKKESENDTVSNIITLISIVTHCLVTIPKPIGNINGVQIQKVTIFTSTHNKIKKERKKGQSNEYRGR